MLKFKLHEELLVRRLQGVTKKVRTAANELREQHAERKINDKELGKILGEIDSTKAALTELTGLVQQIEGEASVLAARRQEQSEVEESTLRKVAEGVDEFADVAILTANQMDYLKSSPPALAGILGQAGVETLALMVEILADQDGWEALETIQRAALARLSDRVR